LVPQFTLAANTNKGLRPSFSSCAEPQFAKILFEKMVNKAKAQYLNTESGVFSADMLVSLVNDGPVTFWLEQH
jgi:D-tyrosyl-tRNA(Tyr) deacylase